MSLAERAELLIKASGANIRFAEDRAYYAPSTDQIVMPQRCQFKASEHSTETEAYYSTLLHELVHWTGHKDRLNRQTSCFGSESYAFEELVAELGSAFLCAELGVSLTAKPENAAYCEHWLKILKQDKSALARAASDASKAIAFLRAPIMGSL